MTLPLGFVPAEPLKGPSDTVQRKRLIMINSITSAARLSLDDVVGDPDTNRACLRAKLLAAAFKVRVYKGWIPAETVRDLLKERLEMEFQPEWYVNELTTYGMREIFGAQESHGAPVKVKWLAGVRVIGPIKFGGRNAGKSLNKETGFPFSSEGR